MAEQNPLSAFLIAPHRSKPVGLYALLFPNGKRYIGISTNPRKRLRLHKAHALKGSTYPVHRAIRKYGIENVRLQVLLIGPRDFILEMEAAAIERFQTRKRDGYNVAVGGSANPMDDPIARAKMIKSLTGRKYGSSASKKASWTPERRAAMSAVHKGKKLSPEHRAKFLHAGSDPETRAKAAASMRARQGKNA